MKKMSLAVMLSCLGAVGLQAQTTASVSRDVGVPVPTERRVVERGANHRVWKWETYEKSPTGQIVARPHQVTELTSGMHYKDAKGKWQESQEIIESYPGGAIARHGRRQVIFANNLNSYGAVDMLTSEGVRLRSHILGLGYYDKSTDKVALIAALKDSKGGLISANQVLYPEAFNGVQADVRYTYRLGSFEQDVILHEQPPSPEDFGMNPETTDLEVFTEFVEAPNAGVVDSCNPEWGQEISWGATRIGHGRAFDLDQSNQAGIGIQVKRQLAKINGRQVLLERVRLMDAKKNLRQLPKQAALRTEKTLVAALNEVIPGAPVVRSTQEQMKYASNNKPDNGFVLDYVIVENISGDITFQADKTYYVSGYNILASVIMEGGAVIKFNTDPNVDTSLYLDGGLPLQINSAPYRPIVLTSQNDESVGESLYDASKPMGPYNYAIFNSTLADPTIVFHDMIVKYARTGLETFWGNAQVYNCQFINCINPIEADTCSLTNVLIVNADTAIIANSATAYHLTIDGCTNVPSSLALTNCLLVNVINNESGATMAANHTATLTSAAGVFQTVGAGSHYLVANSPYRNAGATNVPVGVLSTIRQGTTYSPIVYSNTTISVAATLSPQAQRDTDTPDIGYHYYPLDYVFGGCSLNTNLTFTAGTAVGWFELPGSGGPGYGLMLGNSNTVNFTGTASEPCVLTRYSTVQEGGNGLWTDKGWLAGIAAGGEHDTDHPSALKATFTKFTHLANDPNFFRDYDNVINVTIGHSELYGDSGGCNIVGNYTNCVFFWNNFWQGTADSAYSWETYREQYRNCTFYGGSMEFAHWESSPYWKVLIENCAFDRTTLNFYDAGGNLAWLTANYNATNNPMIYGGKNLPGNSNVEVSDAYNWQNGRLGNLYLSSDSPLINAGSTTANQIGLYHFTTQTDQVKEANSRVDIGYHYVATDAYGYPIDTDGDGIPDYIEDTNGNGLDDLGDLGNWGISSLNGLSNTNGLSVFTPLK